MAPVRNVTFGGRTVKFAIVECVDAEQFLSAAAQLSSIYDDHELNVQPYREYNVRLSNDATQPTTTNKQKKNLLFVFLFFSPLFACSADRRLMRPMRHQRRRRLCSRAKRA